MDQPNKIYSLIPKVMNDVGAIGKNGVNNYDKYNFRSIDDVYNKLQPVLAKHGVFFVPNVIEAHEEHLQSQQGKTQVRVKLRVNYKIFADDGSMIESVVEGEAIDRSDKATNKALTAAFKYLLIQIFCIAVEGSDDADNESPELNFVAEKNPETKPRNFAPETKNDIKIGGGPYQGKRISEVEASELVAYVKKIDEAAGKAGKQKPKWFTDLKQAVGV